MTCSSQTRAVRQCQISKALAEGLFLSGASFPTIAVGIVYGNKASAITIHKLEEIDENGDRFCERINRVIELGCAHTAEDILSFMDDLGVAHL